MAIPAARIFFPEEDRQLLARQIDDILATGQLTLGKYGSEFERRFAAYVQTRYAIAVNSGTSALEIIFRSLDIDGSEVIVPTNTFVATAAAVIHAGGRVVFADIGEDLCLDAEEAKRRITPNTKALVYVHIGGTVPPGFQAIQDLCRERGLHLIEDAAHAQGSTLNDRKAGGFGIAAAFSFYPTKVITSGEGGMITTDDESIYQRALVFRDQGKSGFFGNVHTELGYNWRLSEIHAAVGLSQFGRLDEFIADRRRIAALYDQRLREFSNINLLPIPRESRSNYYKYIAFLRKGMDRVAIKKDMKEKHGVSLSGEVYELPCHLQPIFKDTLGYKGGELPVAEDLCNRHICLPTFARMTDEQADQVINALKEVVS